MADFFDWLKAAGAGEAADELAARFRLSPDEMRATTDALVPAYILGMQRAMIDPKNWSDLAERFGAMGGFAGGKSLAGPAGEMVTGALFGPDLAASIARNASLLTGQAPDTIARFMQPFGAMVFGATLQTMAAGLAGGPKAWPTDSAGQTLAETMRRSANAVEAFHRASDAPAPHVSNPPAAMMALFSDAWRAAFPWLGQAAPSPSPAAPSLFDPFGFLAAAGRPTTQPGTPTKSAASADSPTARRDPVLDMLTNAQSLQADYIRSMVMLFERKTDEKP